MSNGRKCQGTNKIRKTRGPMPFRFYEQLTYHLHNIRHPIRNEHRPITVCQFRHINFTTTHITSIPTRYPVQCAQTSRDYHPRGAPPLRCRPGNSAPAIRLRGGGKEGGVEGALGTAALREGFPLLTIRGNYVVSGSTSVAITFQIRLPRLFAIADTRCRTVRST